MNKTKMWQGLQWVGDDLEGVLVSKFNGNYTRVDIMKIVKGKTNDSQTIL